jgi:glutamine synthetase
MDEEYILKKAYDNRVRFIRLWFTDILGFLKSFSITINELEDALSEGVRFDGSTLHGFARSDEREMIAMPEASTFQILPWRPKEDSVARMFCNIMLMDKTHYEGDSRYILKKSLEEISHRGLTFYTGPEIEFFFFKSSAAPEILDRGGYFDLTPLDVATDFRRQTVMTLEEMGIDVITSHHEASYSQHEIDLRHDNALTTADNIMTFKLVAKEIGQHNNIYASFMPKPLANQNGSGLHVHQSLFKGEENMFFHSSDEHHLSKTAKQFIAGLLHHSNEFLMLTNQWMNSYKRLMQGFESPTHSTWSPTSPSALVRIPQCNPDKPHSMRIELRSPDPACNPYLVFAAILAAGMKGIDENYEIPEPFFSDDECSSKNSQSHQPLQKHLHGAMEEFRKSSLMRDTLGEFIFNKLIENKVYEINKYNNFITDFEIKEYLQLL